MARRDEIWVNRAGGYIEPNAPSGFDILNKGTDRYLNWNTIVGATGYGLRDNAGQMQFKHSGGDWADFGGSTPPGGSDTHVQYNDGGSAFGGDAGLTWNKTLRTLTLTNNVALATGESSFAIIASGVNTGSASALIDIRQTNTSNTKTTVYLQQSSTSGGARNVHLRNDGTGDCVFIDQNGNAKSVYIDSEATNQPAVELDIVDGDAHCRFTGDSGNASPTEGDLWRESDGLKYYDGTTEHNLLSGSYESFGITLDGQGGVISTGLKGFIEIPYAGTITGWTLVADQSGSIVIDVWKDTYANFPPTVADTIAGTEKPTLSSVQKNQDLTLTTWTTAVTAGDILAFNVDSASTVTRVNLIIRITKG